MVRTVRAGGAVLWREGAEGSGDIEIAVVHRPRYDDWSLPKGKLVDGETTAHAAVREVAEETGFRTRLSRRLGSVDYPLPGSDDRKSVTYFAAEALHGEFTVNDEVDELRWLPVQEAHTPLSYQADREVLARFGTVAHPVRTVLLVRHAKAGRKADWTGDDDLRPLSSAGRCQTDALHDLLPLFGPTRVYSAPPLRCLETVRPVAADLRVPIIAEPTLSEDGYWLDPAAGLGRLLAIAGGEGVPVISSQGGVIPDLIATITDRLTEKPAAVSKKASIWVLFFAPGEPRLLAADYYPSPLPAPAIG